MPYHFSLLAPLWIMWIRLLGAEAAEYRQHNSDFFHIDSGISEAKNEHKTTPANGANPVGGYVHKREEKIIKAMI